MAPRPWGARTTRLRRPRTSPPDAQTTASLAIRRRILMETFVKRRSSRTPVDRSRPGRPAIPCAHDALASTASPAQRVVTFARRPSWRAGMAEANHNLRKYERAIFLREGLDSPNQLEWKSEIGFHAQAALADRRRWRPAKIWFGTDKLKSGGPCCGRRRGRAAMFDTALYCTAQVRLPSAC